MSAPPQAKGEPITSKAQLVEYLEAGSKPRADWRIGTEHEKFAFCPKTFRPLAYEGKASIRALLEGLQRFGWQPVLENGARVMVPPHIETGTRIVVRPEDVTYVERAKD